MTTTKKLVVAVVALSLALVSVVGATLAYLFDVTGAIENVFNPQNIDVALTETDREYKMIPSVDLPKDPKVTIDSDIECYVFVEVSVENNTWNNGTKDIEVIEWAVADGWNLLPNSKYVYYREVKTGTYSVLKDDKVKVSEEITKVYMNGVENATISKPKLTFKAYAVQKANGDANFTAAEAFAIAKGN